MIIDFMDLTNREKVLCTTFMLKKDARFWWDAVKMRRDITMMTWEDFLQEFNRKFYDLVVLRPQQKEFAELKQENMTISKVCRKFDRLSRLCLYVVPTDRDKIQKMIGMFRPKISALVDNGTEQPTSAADCVNRAIRAEFHLARQ